MRFAPELELADLVPERVDADLRETVAAPELRVESRLDPGLPDAISPAIPVPTEPLELLRRDLPDVAEDLSREGRVRVVAEIDLGDLDAGELGLVLVQVVDLVLAHRSLHDDRRKRVGSAFVDLARECLRRDLEHLGEPLHEPVPAFLRHVTDPELDGRARHVRDDRPAAPIEDRPPRRLYPNKAELVVLRRVQVLVPRQHLERPETEEE